MIREDRELLNRLATVNQSLGEFVLDVISRQDGGELNAADLRKLGRALCTLGTDMTIRADRGGQMHQFDHGSTTEIEGT